jgi:hypothetical protein
LKADSVSVSTNVSNDVISFSQALYSVHFVGEIEWTPNASRQSAESDTLAKIENGVTTPEALRHAAAAQHFKFGGGGQDCHGTALVFVQWDNMNIADFLFRATVLDAFFSQFDSAAGLKPGTLSSHVDTLIIWAGLASWSRRFAQLIAPKADIVTRKQLEAGAARCWSNAFFFTDSTPQVAVIAPTTAGASVQTCTTVRAAHTVISELTLPAGCVVLHCTRPAPTAGRGIYKPLALTLQQALFRCCT